MRSRALWSGIAALVGTVVALAGLSAAGEQPKPGGTLRVAFGSDIHSGRFTLNRSSPTGYETFWVMNNTHNALVTLNHDFEIVPDLAKSWTARRTSSTCTKTSSSTTAPMPTPRP